MPTDPLEARLDSLNPRAASPAPGVFLAAVARRRRGRMLSQFSAAAVILVVAGVALVVAVRPNPAPSGLGPDLVLITPSAQIPPTIAAIYAANPDLAPETLRLPESASGGAAEPITARSFGSVGG